MARPNQFSFIPTNGRSAGCSIASRYNGGVQTDYAMSNAPSYTHAAPSNFITPNSQCCWGASVSGHFPKGENDWNEKRHDPLNQTSGQQSRHLPMFIPTASHFPNEPAPEHTLTLRDPRIDQR
ncbi:hypothetical protein N7490_006256 [Penicillium lividum]|nr:hypothetical protein N7490_006256 [Penicillium lividum]